MFIYIMRMYLVIINIKILYWKILRDLGNRSIFLIIDLDKKIQFFQSILKKYFSLGSLYFKINMCLLLMILEDKKIKIKVLNKIFVVVISEDIFIFFFIQNFLFFVILENE